MPALSENQHPLSTLKPSFKSDSTGEKLRIRDVSCSVLEDDVFSQSPEKGRFLRDEVCWSSCEDVMSGEAEVDENENWEAIIIGEEEDSGHEEDCVDFEKKIEETNKYSEADFGINEDDLPVIESFPANAFDPHYSMNT